MEYRAEFYDYIEVLVSRSASDLHCIVGSKPMFRVYRELMPFIQKAELTEKDIEAFLNLIVKDLVGNPVAYVKENKHLLFSYQHETKTGKKLNFRCVAYLESGNLALAMRLIPLVEKTLEELNLPPILSSIMNRPQGLFLVVGPAGNGKSTALASMIQDCNVSQNKHILTIEDPIEFIFENKRSIISQREIPRDAVDFRSALDTALRADADVLMIGEMREVETMKVMMTAAEVGHLALSTVHANSAASTVDRIIDSFPPLQQQQVVNQFASSLLGVCSIRLLPRISGGLIPACEILLNTTAVSNIIRERRNSGLNSVIQTSSADGMMSLEQSLANLVKKGEIALEVAQNYAPDRVLLSRYL